MFSGPLASVLTNKYGCRVTTIAGAIIAAAGFILSLWAPNLYFLYFSFGIMSGMLSLNSAIFAKTRILYFALILKQINTMKQQTLFEYDQKTRISIITPE